MAEKRAISKLSVKTLGCNPKEASAKNENDNTPVVLCVIMGVCNTLKTWEDARTSQIFTALVGNFEGINLKTGESYTSGKCFLPSGIQEVIESAVKESEKAEQEPAIRFSLKIQAVRASNPIGYSYQAVSLIPPSQNDTLSELRAISVQKVPLMLKAPPSFHSPAPTTAPVVQIAGPEVVQNEAPKTGKKGR